MIDLWKSIKDCLEEYLSGPGYQTFLSSTKPLHLENNTLTIEVPNNFSKEWIRDKCEPLLKEMLPIINNSFLFEYVIKIDNYTQNEEQLSIFTPPQKNTQEKIESTRFNPKYTFDNFIVGHNNRFAYAASEAVAKTPAKAYNPLFIYGSVGLGKTHLLHSIGLKAQQENPHLTAKLVSCEKFTNFNWKKRIGCLDPWAND